MQYLFALKFAIFPSQIIFVLYHRKIGAREIEAKSILQENKKKRERYKVPVFNFKNQLTFPAYFIKLSFNYA